MVKVISWNLARREEAWRCLLNADADIALVQEASPPPADIAHKLELDPAPFSTAGAGKYRPWRAGIVKLSNRVEVQWLETKSIEDSESGELAVSRPGTLAAALVTPPTREPFVVVSMYSLWESPHSSTRSNWIISDASAHRLISDLSVLIGQQTRHRILAAGDLNILHGHGEYGSPYWASRYWTIFSRMKVLGMPFVGPQAPAGRQAEPWPDELPSESKNVPTFYTTNQTPATATRQLDYVFASKSLSKKVKVKALNDPEHWGPSDHCQIVIEVDPNINA